MGWGGKFPVTPPWITRLHRFPDCCSDVMKEGERNFSIPASLPSSDRGSTETEALAAAFFFFLPALICLFSTEDRAGNIRHGEEGG